jgi:RimJ/RimL family protein N-acetyltransferase
MMPGATVLPTLATERLRLRWLLPADVPALFSIFGDAEVCRYWSSPPLADDAAARLLLADIVRGFETRTLLQWGVELRETATVIGTCTLHAMSSEHRRAEVGFALASAHWKHGYIAEALEALLDYAFDDLALHRIEADVDPRNDSSIRALERLGFQREGYLRERYHLGGEVQDALFYGLLQPEWIARRRRAPRP